MQWAQPGEKYMENTTNNRVKETAYFSNRNIGEDAYSTYKLPRYLGPYFTDADKDLSVLDIGCGLGQTLNFLKERGYTNLYGVDINEEAIQACKAKGISAERMDDTRDFAKVSKVKYDRIIMSHVLEHIDKELIIDTLIHIKKYLLKEGGIFLLMVPNAQAPNGTYWRYEDFTHTILFTSGSCLYVLKAAGFTSIEFIDPDGTKHMSPVKRVIIKTLLAYITWKERLRNKVLQTFYHEPSPKIFSYEIRVAAK